MGLMLEQIIFNHTPMNSSISALNIRKNKLLEGVVPPEWEKGKDDPEESPAAYAIQSITGRPVKIVAVFDRSNLRGPVEIRALNGGVLGQLDPKSSTGTTNPSHPGWVNIEFPLSHHTIQQIGIYDVQWQWQYREIPFGQWQDLTVSDHRIYVILDLPQSPWINKPGQNYNPWTDVLDVICPLVAGKKEKKYAAARLLTELFYERGYQYDIGEDNQVAGQAAYADFSLSESWKIDPLEFLNQTAGKTVNCYDCAAGFKALGSSLGIDLKLVYHETFGYLNYVMPIGREVCNNPAYMAGMTGVIHDPIVGPDETYPGRTHFDNHAYCRYNGNNYDLTMKSVSPPPRPFIAVVLNRLLYPLIRNFGRIGIDWLDFAIDKLNGWLVDISEQDYRNKVIDTSTYEETIDPIKTLTSPRDVPFTNVVNENIVLEFE